MTVEIAEIMERCDLDRGVLEPFICRDEAGDTYYLKGSNCTAHGLTAEWLASNLAREFGLPVPKPVIARVDTDLIDIAPRDWQNDLKYEYYFASTAIPHAQPPTYTQSQAVNFPLKSDIAVFDYWVRNEDRQLGERGGNVNLLFEPSSESLYVIDFNMAFDSEFDTANILEKHVFGDALRAVAEDLLLRQSYKDRFENALQNLDNIVSHVPEEWIDLSCGYASYTDEMEAVLTRFRDSDFWNQLP